MPKKGVRCYGGVDVASGAGNQTDNSTIAIYDADGQQMASFMQMMFLSINLRKS